MNKSILKQKITQTLMNNLIKHAPVRTHPLGKLRFSPHPGNLRQNGIYWGQNEKNYYEVIIGGDPAPYGPYTNRPNIKTSGWIEKAIEETINLCERLGGVKK